MSGLIKEKILVAVAIGGSLTSVYFNCKSISLNGETAALIKEAEELNRKNDRTQKELDRCNEIPNAITDPVGFNLYYDREDEYLKRNGVYPNWSHGKEK